MPWQMGCSRSPFLLGVLALAAAPGCGDAASGEAPGITFSIRELRLGTLPSGTTREVVFPFTVAGEAVVIRGLQPSCGCLRPRVTVAGRLVPPGEPLAPGTRGEVRAAFVTTGFQGPKHTRLEVLGEGPGLPALLTVEAELEPWCRLDPPVLDLGTLDGREPVRRRVVVEAGEPFRLLAPATVPEPLELEGLPSPAAARSQEFTVVLGPGAPAGPQRLFLRLRADNDLELQLPIQFRMAPPLYLVPSRRLLLGVVPARLGVQSAVLVGATEGRLLPPVGRLEGWGEAARVDAVTLEAGRRYRLRLVVPPGLPPGPRRGTLKVLLRREVEGRTEEEERTLEVIGVVQEAGS